MSGQRGDCRRGRTYRSCVAIVLFVGGVFVASGAAAQSSDEIEILRRELAARQAEIDQQRQRLVRQQAELERQAAELAALAARLERTAVPGGAAGEAAQVADRPQPGPDHRDAVGDLNAAAVAAGDFPGSIRIPGSQEVSLAIGGFIKAVAIADSDLEGAGAVFLPANMGASRPDVEGSTSLDASLSRTYLDARAPTPMGSVRGYLEVDLNSANNGSLGFQVRHAYGAWRTGRGTLTAGHTWSTAMDLGVLPEGLTEPTVSGAIFQRQAQLRWSQSVTDRFKLDIALEDGTSSDATISGAWRASTRLPDLIAATGWDWGRAGHLRVTLLARQIRVVHETGESATATGWGVSLGGHVGVGRSDKLAFGANFGEGTGRYLLGVPGGSAGFIDVDRGALDLLRGAGAFVTYRHAWTPRLRSTAAYGRAWVEDAPWQAADAFDSSSFALVNLMWSPLHYVTLGAEYQYGERKAKDGSARDNRRLILGIQLF